MPDTTPTATIKLYKASNFKNFTANKLFMIDSISTFLVQEMHGEAPFSASIQYHKHKLNDYVKIVLNQDYAMPYKTSSYSYCSIQNSDSTRIFYYWVKNITWKSQNCCELELIMDVLNTFQIGTDYKFSPRTIITRRHKNRWKKITGDATTLSILESCYIASIGDYVEDDYLLNLTPALVSSMHSNEIEFIGGADILDIFDKETMTSFKFLSSVTLITASNNSLTFTYNGGNTYTLEEYSRYYFLFSSPTLDINGDQTDGDLFVHQLTNYATQDAKTIYIPLIDMTSEDINPTLYKELDITLEDERSVSMNWYLAYNTSGMNNEVVDCYLIPENAISVNVEALLLTGGTITPDMLQDNTPTYILLRDPNNHWSGSLTKYYDNFYDDAGNRLELYYSQTDIILEVLELYKEDGVIRATIHATSGDSNSVIEKTWLTSYVVYTGTYTTITYGTSSFDLLNANQSQHLGNTLSSSDLSGYEWGTNYSRILTSYASMDRTLSTLIKIIKLPYIPYEFSIDGNTLVIDDKWTITSWNGLTNVLKLNKLDTKLVNSLLLPSDFVMPREKILNSYKTGVRTKYDNEPKMFNSEFFGSKFLYDSFGWGYIPELVNYENAYNNRSILQVNVIEFNMTTTINSRMAFEFKDTYYDRGADDYPTWLTITRNNEEVIYNSAYLNYIRNGYNYDVKAKNQAIASNWISAGSSLALTALTLGATIASQGATAPLLVATISGAIASAGTLTNAIMTTNQNERSLEQKLDQLKMQSASVSGSDDIDIMTRYSGNRLRYLEYRPSPRMTSLLNSLFYFFGYKDNVCEDPTGSLDTRNYFNYLQCKPEFNYVSSVIPQDCLEELRRIMETGFTKIHRYHGSWSLDFNTINDETNIS